MNNESALEELAEMKFKVDRIFEMLSPILVSAEYLTKVQGLNENTISRNESVEKYNQIGKRGSIEAGMNLR